ncbi:MAG: sugar ABC transporter permease [Devosia sp.]|uniref:sugar ABC transporter permease n=1 Tax=Devosia sp. TaxID=1871048 RepID=UPI001AD18C72|nr:sugar ABC transporter permease [Devosia sp.]MBN9314595.1 sugar ABC transporter permease [Devosia sp.]
MAEQSGSGPATSNEGLFTRLVRAAEIDTRMLGMIAAMFLIWVGFDVLSGILRPGGGGLLGGTFLTSRNLWILLVQTSVIAVMTTGMVLIIVLRQIDLSVGSMLNVVAITAGVLQVFQLGPWLGVGHPIIWIIAVLVALLLGAAIGAFNGVLIAYGQIPSFIVTLGGLIAYRGIAFLIASGVTVAPMDKTFKLIGGNGPAASIGPVWSWVLAAVACVAIGIAVVGGRRRRVQFGFKPKPVWAEILSVVVGCAAVLGTTAVVNSYLYPPKVAERFALDNNIPIPTGVEAKAGLAICKAGDKVVTCLDGLSFQTGYPIPVLIMIAVGLIMTFVAKRTRFGRYVFATGGNPEAAELAGINTKRLTVMVFTLMGGLVGVSAIIASARLDAATTALGTLNELYVIAAAVIGGTSLAGGIGTIYGAILGALLMQSLQSGMGLLNADSAYTDVVTGLVLVLAVFVDQVYRRRVK